MNQSVFQWVSVLILTLMLNPARAQSPAVLPRLTIQQAPNGSVAVSWLNDGSNAVLERAADLSPSTIWRTVQPGPQLLNNQFSFALDASPATTFFRLRPLELVSVRTTSPLDGETGVAVTRETVVHFSAPLSTNSIVTGTNFFAGFGGRRLLARIELSSDRTKASLFYLEPLPGNTRVVVVFDGTGLTDATGSPIDADDDGVPGGVAVIAFDTLNLTPSNGTGIVGRVFASELMPGLDTGTNAVNRPLAGVTITVDGREQDLRAVTDENGNFSLSPAPSGRFFVHIDGRTVKNLAAGIFYPDLSYYPFVGKAWEAVAGRTNNLAGGTGTIYLPLITAGTLQPVSLIQPTTISFPASVVAKNPALAGVSLTVPANSLFSDDGTRGGKIGIAPVPPDRLPGPLPGPLPPGAELPLVITVQSDGPLNFDQPVPACFPNLPNPTTGKSWPPGTKGALISFNHKKGVWENVGGMTVSADGKLFCTDPGVGILQAGWHGAQSPPPFGPPPPTTRKCNYSIDKYDGCLGTCELNSDACDARNKLFEIRELRNCELDYIVDGSMHGGPLNLNSIDRNICLRDIYDSATIIYYQCSSASSKCTTECITCYGTRHNDPPTQIRKPTLRPTNPRNITGAHHSLDPVGDQIDALIRQINALIAPFAATQDIIPSAVFDQIDGLLKQADQVSGGDCVSYLSKQLITIEEQIANLAAEHGLEPDELTPGNAPAYPVPYVATVARPIGLYQLRGQTEPFGQYEIFLPADGTLVNVTFYDPKTKTVGIITPNLSPNAPHRLPRFYLFPLPGDALDFDHDGLPDLVEDVFGTDPAKSDTDGDGIPDGVEVDQGMNPLDGLAVQIGVVATTKTPGAAIDVWTGNNLIVTAEGTAGVSVLNVTPGGNPTLIAHVQTPGDALRVVGTGNYLAVAEGDAGVTVFDISTPATPRTLYQLRLVGAQAITADAGRLYVGLSTGAVAVVDLGTGALVQQISVNAAVWDLALADDYLYALTDDRIWAISLTDGALNLAGSAGAPFAVAPNRRLFVGGGVGYSVHRTGFDTFDLTQPGSPVLLAAGNTSQFGWKQLVANGSGGALAAVGPNSTDDGPHDISLYEVKDPAKTDVVLTTFPTPGIARAVSIFNGLAYVADDTAGIEVINYQSYDTLGVPPTIALTTSFPPQGVKEGARVRLTANARDDVQVSRVEFYVDGARVFSDGSFPFEYRFTTPGLTATKTNFTLRARAFDTGGNATFTDEIVVPLLSNQTPPQVTATSPTVNVKTVTSVVAIFSKPMNSATLSAGSFQLLSAGSDGHLDTADDFLVPGGVVTYRAESKAASVDFTSPLPDGLYRALVTATVSDLAGNQLATNHVWEFRVAGRVTWIRSTDGRWDDPQNWSTGAVPGPDDRVTIDVAGEVTITHDKGFTKVESLSSNAHLAINGGTFRVFDAFQISKDLILNGGTLKGGNLTSFAGAKVILTGNNQNILDQVTVNGDLDATADDARLTILNGLVLNGVLRLDNSGAVIFPGTQTFTKGTIEFAGNSGYFGLSGDANLTLGPGVVIHGKSGKVGQSLSVGGTQTLINHGLISADVAGGTLLFNGQNFSNGQGGRLEGKNGGSLMINCPSWRNDGVIDISNGTALTLGGAWNNGGTITLGSSPVTLGGTIALDDLGTINNLGGPYNVTGTVDLKGNTLSLDAVTNSWRMNGATIKNGTITQAGAGRLILTGNNQNTLDNTTVNGDLDATADDARLTILNGLRLNGVLRLDNSAAVLFQGTQTFATGTVEFTGNSGYFGLSGEANLTLGPTVVIHGKTGRIGQSLAFGSTQILINQGLISADVAGGALTINPGQFSNPGVISATVPGATVIIRVTPFTNTGTIQELNGGRVLINP